MPRANPSSFGPFIRRNWHIGFIAMSVLVFIATLGGFFYLRAQSIMQEQLRDKLRITAATAAMQFSAADITLVRSRESMDLPAYRGLVLRLQTIRDSMPGVDFVYIMRRTGNDNVLEFVADADSLLDDSLLDRDGNGVVDGYEEASYPGDLYDISEIPALRGPAFERPTVDEEVTLDQWGSMISGYAPIRDPHGRVVAVLGLDMHANEFLRLTHSIFSPVVFLLVLVAAAMIAFYIFWAVVSRRLDSMRQMDDERSSLLQLALHRLGTPLTIFKWSVEMLQDCNNGESCPRNSVDEHVRQMSEGIRRMEEIIKALLAADRAEMSPLRLAPEQILIRPVIEEVVETLRPRLALEKQQIDVDPDGVMEVRADRRVLTGVLHELIENASIYSPQGSVIRVRARKQRGWTKIEVRDQGIGISLVDLQRIFGRFVRGSNASIVHPDGNGLGLYTARHLIESAGGRIWLQSEGEGKGTTACITLPLIERGMGQEHPGGTP